MNDHIKVILASQKFSDEFKEEAVLCFLFKGEDSILVMESFEI